MRAREFLNELRLDIPNQMVTVQIPLNDIVSGSAGSDEEPVVNPGKRPGKDGKYKWSPPLQQQLDVAKDAVGQSTDDLTVDDSEDSLEQNTQLDDLRKKLAAVLGKNISMP